MSCIFTTFHDGRSWWLWTYKSGRDNHHNCLSCSSCSRLSTCSTCSLCSEKTWILADKWQTYSARWWVMRKKNKQNKKKRLAVNSDLSDDNSFDGSTTPQGSAARSKTHQGGDYMDAECNQNTSPPVTSQPGTSQPVTSQPVTGKPVTGQTITGQPVTGQFIWSTSHWSLVIGHSVITGHWVPVTITRHWAFNQVPVTGHQAPVNLGTVIMHHSIGNEHQLANQSHMGSEQSFSNEPQNPTASKRVLLPLEPDFSQISDPSIIIDPPSNTWQSTDRHTSQTRRSRRDQPKTKQRTKKRRRHRSSSSSSSLASHRRSKRSKRSKHSHMRRKRCWTSSSSSSSSSHSNMN